jgi:ADP-ribosylation factor-binding protein GGA
MDFGCSNWRSWVIRCVPFLLSYIYTYNVWADTFLQINDQINTVLTRYDAFKKGDFPFASNPIPEELAAGSGSSQGISLIDFDDSAPASSETTGVGNDLSGLFSYVAQPAQVPAQYQPQQQQQQPPPPSTYAPTPLFYNNNGGGGGMNTYMQSTPISMTPHTQRSGTPPASIALPQSKPGSQRSTPVPAAAAAATPNYFGNVGARGPVESMGVNRGMGSGWLPMSMPGINAGGAPSAMNLSGAMSGMSLNGGGNMMGMGPNMFHHPQSTGAIPQQQPQQATTTPAAPPPHASGTDPFADLAGLFWTKYMHRVFFYLLYNGFWNKMFT